MYMLNELGHSLWQGNLFMIVILCLGILGFGVFLWRFFLLTYSYNLNFNKFLRDIRKMIAAEDHDRAINLCKGKDSLPKIALRALEAAETDPTTVRGTLEEETIDFVPRLEKGINFLPACAMLVLLTGILGTIDSLWAAFHSVDVLDTAKKQATLAQSIASSLNPTAAGLIIAMLLLAAQQLLKGVAVNITERIHHGVAVLHNLLVPPEVATFMPAMASGSDGVSLGAQQVSEPTFSNDTVDEGDSTDDSFDDVSVEDIKDEEEII